MNKPTDQEMLTKVVQRGVDGKWRLNGYVTKVELLKIEMDNMHFREIAGIGCQFMPPFFIFKIITQKGHGTQFYTLPDLIADHEFMKVVYGEEYCNVTTCKLKLAKYQYIQQQAISLPEHERVKYLYGSMEGV